MGGQSEAADLVAGVRPALDSGDELIRGLNVPCGPVRRDAKEG